MPDLDPEDRNRNAIMQAAAACLEHVRRVSYGLGSARYEVNDGKRRLLITIEVASIGNASTTPEKL